MNSPYESNLCRLVASQLGGEAADRLLDGMVVDPALLTTDEGISAAQLAMALNVLLFDDLLDRVPTGARYVAETLAGGGRMMHDHGALRTIRFLTGPTGALPAGADAFARILGPLGYVRVRDYPLPALRMTGQAWCHRAFPETIPQFFVSELHVEHFPADFQAAATRVFGTSRDPLTSQAQGVLDRLANDGGASFDDAATALPVLVAAFGRHHELCMLDDYETLLAESSEAAWIATEGNIFNHATDRVDDVDTLSARLRDEGKPMKPMVERSANGRVRQTAFRADLVERQFMAGGTIVTRTVPGSFYEFISRDIVPETGRLDLTFDSGNAQGIFAMTQAA